MTEGRGKDASLAVLRSFRRLLREAAGWALSPMPRGQEFTQCLIIQS